jgi:hypothetical protein
VLIFLGRGLFTEGDSKNGSTMLAKESPQMQPAKKKIKKQ